MAPAFISAASLTSTIRERMKETTQGRTIIPHSLSPPPHNSFNFRGRGEWFIALDSGLLGF